MRPFIVVIDGSMTVRKILEITLERAGWSVCTFADGLQALKALEHAKIPAPEAIVLDVGLPKKNGYAVARAFKHQQRCRQCVILFLSDQNGLFDKFRRRLAGGTAYLTKPFTASEVLGTLKAALRRTRETRGRAEGGEKAKSQD